MWRLAEIIERISGMHFCDFIRNCIIGSLGLEDFFLGLPDSESGRVTEIVHCGDSLTSENFVRLGVPESHRPWK